MIGAVSSGAGFGGLQSYLLRGRNGQDTDRVLWTTTRGLPSHDPEHAAPVMRATAEQSERVEKPVWHLSLSAEPGAEIDRERWERIADRVLGELGLQDHQVLIVAHGDTRHPHIHLMVNRVHPVHHRAWSTSHDYSRVQRVLRHLERDLGLREVPGTLYQLEPSAAPDRTESLTSGEVRELRRTGEPTFAERARTVLRSEFRDARSWADLYARLEAHGYHLEPRGRGLVVSDGQRSVKASRISRASSAHRLAERFGQTFQEWSRARHDVLTAATEERVAGELLARAQRPAAVGKDLARAASDADSALRMSRLRNAETAQRFSRDLAAAYQDPSAARRAALRHIRQHGWNATATALEHRPATFGPLRRGALGAPRREARTAAHRAAFSARQLARLRPQRAQLATTARYAHRDYLAYERRTGARRRLRVAQSRHRAAQHRLGSAARRATKDLAKLLPFPVQKAIKTSLRLTQRPQRTAVGIISSRVIPRTAAAAAFAFGASALQFALKPNPLTAAKTIGSSARALGELGRDAEADRGR